MGTVRSLSLGAACFVAWSCAGQALSLGVRDNDGDDGPPAVPPPTHGPPKDGGNGRRPTSYWTFRPSPTTPPLIVPPPATFTPTLSTPIVSFSPVTGTTTTNSVVVTVPTSTSSTLSTVPPGNSSWTTESAVESQPTTSSTVSETQPTTMSSDTPTSTASSTAASSSNDASDLGSNRTLVITLSTVLSVIGALIVVGAMMICLKCRKRRGSFFARGISPIDDDEIATWKTSRDEKAALASAGAAAGTGVAATASRTPGHAQRISTSTVRKPPSVIVYQGRHSQQLPRPSGEGSPRSVTITSPGYHGRTSFDKELPQTPIQAVAPNARAGLTDEAVPGADPFLPSPKRHASRLSKVHPYVSSPRSTHTHTRTRSSRSSTRSFGGEYGGYYAGSDMELSPRTSNDYYNNMHYGHSRVYSSSSIPPRLSFGEDGVVGGLSPRPLFRDNDMIGRAIG